MCCLRSCRTAYLVAVLPVWLHEWTPHGNRSHCAPARSCSALIANRDSVFHFSYTCCFPTAFLAHLRGQRSIQAVGNQCCVFLLNHAGVCPRVHLELVAEQREFSCSMTETKSISQEQLLQHVDEKDCWLAIHGKVYDVSSYLVDHPGGLDVMMEFAGAYTLVFSCRIRFVAK